MEGEQKRQRVDAGGRACAGSQRQLQTYVNCRQDEFSQKVLSSLVPSPGRGARLQWVSPMAEEGFLEYQDTEFLDKLGLGDHLTSLREFWPNGGPCWDALARVTGCSPEGVVLVEAKSHVSELQSSCAAESPVSRAKIEASLACTKRRLGVDAKKDWMNGCYQAANRYAHMMFLRDLGVQAWLVNVYFLNDHSIPSPATELQWRSALANVKKQMGLEGKSPGGVSELFLDVPQEIQRLEPPQCREVRSAPSPPPTSGTTHSNCPAIAAMKPKSTRNSRRRPRA
jgi:hypothetical protein